MSTTSLFFRHLSSPLPAVTYYLLETFTALAEANPEETAEAVLRQSLVICGHEKNFPLEQLVKILEGMKDIEAKSRKAVAAVDGAPGSSGKKSFGQDYLDWVNTLNIEQLLLVISDYDFPAACTYYSEVPIEAISVAAELFFKSDWLSKQSSLESAVVGAGGDLGSSKPKPGYDLTDEKTSHAAVAKLKSIGF